MRARMLHRETVTPATPVPSRSSTASSSAYPRQQCRCRTAHLPARGAADAADGGSRRRQTQHPTEEESAPSFVCAPSLCGTLPLAPSLCLVLSPRLKCIALLCFSLQNGATHTRERKRKERKKVEEGKNDRETFCFSSLSLSLSGVRLCLPLLVYEVPARAQRSHAHVLLGREHHVQADAAHERGRLHLRRLSSLSLSVSQPRWRLGVSRRRQLEQKPMTRCRPSAAHCDGRGNEDSRCEKGRLA